MPKPAPFFILCAIGFAAFFSSYLEGARGTVLSIYLLAELEK